MHSVIIIIIIIYNLHTGDLKISLHATNNNVSRVHN